MKMVKRIFVMILATIIAIMSSMSVMVFATKNMNTPVYRLDNISQHEQLIYDYYDSINDGDWQAWASCYAKGVRHLYEDFVTDKIAQMNNTGILAVDSTEVISIDKISNDYAPYYRELEQYYSFQESYECYMVGIDMTVEKETKYFYNGVNYKLVIIVNDDGEWGIGATCGCPIELLVNAMDVYPVEDAIQSYYKRAFGNVQSSFEIILNEANIVDGGFIIRAIGTGFITGDINSPPATINVGDGKIGANNMPERKSDATFTPTLSDYVYNATSNEVYASYNAEAIKACAVAIKMFAWWCSLGTYRETFECDLLGNYDQAYDNSMTTYPTTVAAAVDDVIDYYIISGSTIGTNSGKFFSTNCNNFTSYDYWHSGVMVQSGTHNLAANYGYTWQGIVHYYFDNCVFYFNSI